MAGIAAKGVLAVWWQRRHVTPDDAFEVSCAEPAVMLKRMAGFNGSWLPLLEREENDAVAGTLESAWHRRQSSEVSAGRAGSGQVKSGTAAWNETPFPAVICACVWQLVQSTRTGSLLN